MPFSDNQQSVQSNLKPNQIMLPKYPSQVPNLEATKLNSHLTSVNTTQARVSGVQNLNFKNTARVESSNLQLDNSVPCKKPPVISPTNQTKGAYQKIIAATAMEPAKAGRKPVSRNQKINNHQDQKHAKSGNVQTAPLMNTGLSTLRNNKNYTKYGGIDEIPQELVEDHDMEESEANKMIRQPWISAQKREINMTSPKGFNSNNFSQNYGDQKQSYLAVEGEINVTDPNKKSKPPIAKRGQKIQRSASPIMDNVILMQVNSKGTATMIQSRGTSPQADMNKQLTEPNFTIRPVENEKGSRQNAPNTSRLSVNTISHASNTKSQSKYFQNTHISVGKVYQVQGLRDSSPHTNYNTQQFAVDASQYSTQQPPQSDMVIQENTASQQRKLQPSSVSKDIVKKVYQYVIPNQITKTRQSRNTLQVQQPVIGLKTMGYQSVGSAIHSKPQTAHMTTQNLSIEFAKTQKTLTGVESKQTVAKHATKILNYKNQIPKAILTLECSRTPDTGNQSLIVNQSQKQTKTDELKKRMEGAPKTHHMPNKSQASLGSEPSNSSMSRHFVYMPSKANKNYNTNQPTAKKPIEAIVGKENPYNNSIQSDCRKQVNISEITNARKKPESIERDLVQNNLSIGAGQRDYLHTYNEFELEENESNSMEQPSVYIYSTRRPSASKNHFKSPTIISSQNKKFQNQLNSQATAGVRKQPITSLKMKSLSPSNVFGRLANQNDRIAEVNGFQKTMIVKKVNKPGQKEVSKGIHERLRQKYNISKSPEGRESKPKRQSKVRSNASGGAANNNNNTSAAVDFSKTKFLNFANQVRKSVNGDIGSQMNEVKAIQFINDEKNQEMLFKQINVPHFDIWIDKTKDKGTLLHYLCLQNKMPNLIEVLLKKKVQLTTSSSKKVLQTKQALVDKEVCTLKNNFSSLQLASFGLHTKVIEKLLLCKCNANHKDIKNRTMLWYLVDMFQKEASFKFPNRKIIGQIQEIIELIAPFSEESLKIADTRGQTVSDLASDEELKNLLNGIFNSYQMPSGVFTRKKEDYNDSSSMSNTDEFQVSNVQLIQHQAAKQKRSTIQIEKNPKAQAKNQPTKMTDKTQKHYGADMVFAQGKAVQQMSIELFEPGMSATTKNLAANHKNPDESGDTHDQAKKRQPIIGGRQIDEHLPTQILETQQSILNQDELNALIIRAEEEERNVNQSYQQAQVNAHPSRNDEDYGAPSGGPQTQQDEERGEYSDVHDQHRQLETPTREQHIKLSKNLHQMLEFGQNISRSANQASNRMNGSKTLGVSRNNFGAVEEQLTPMQLEKIQTVETPFKMKDVIKNEKFERISSMRFQERSNMTENPRQSRRQLMADKVIGQSFLGSCNINGSESKYEPDQVGPSHFRAHQLLGTGSFGEVFLVEEIATKELYAMKVLSKEKINEQYLLKYAFAEKQIMAEMTKINHPYIVKIKYTFQTTESLFMIMQFCSGGDLSQYLELEGCFDEEKAKIYICEIICALEALHKQNIIFRDLKPDNIVLDADGHCLLTDFGLSRMGISGNMSGADSFCGSYAYLAPEMIRKQGHGKAVDWYLIGVVLYELLTGLPPFYDDDKEILFNNIQNNKLTFPDESEVPLSRECKDLLQKLLIKDPRKRLGNIGGIREIKVHPFFDGVDWKRVAARQSEVPPAYLSEMALDIIAKQPFMLQDHPKTQGEPCPPGHPMHIDDWEMNMTSQAVQVQERCAVRRMSRHFQQ